MADFKMVTKKVNALVNGKVVPGILRMRKYRTKPKSIARPVVLTDEQRAAFWARHPDTKPLHRPKRRRFKKPG